jgi:RNA polymerase sigma-70 factor (ECF subfamily)
VLRGEPVIPGRQNKFRGEPQRPSRSAAALTLRCRAATLSRVEDHALVLAWRSGQREAGRNLISRHYKAVFRFFFGKVPLATCEDLAQQTFEVLCRRPEGFRGEGSFRAYLLGVARFVLIGHIRRNRPHEPVEDSILPADDPSASALLGARQTLRLVATALRGLELDDQILIELKDWEGLSQAELATLFGVPQPTVARRLQRARLRLRSAVEAVIADPSSRAASLRNLDSCLQSIRVCIDARWGSGARGVGAP